MKALPAAVILGVTAAAAFFAGRWSADAEGDAKPAKGRALISAAPPAVSSKESEARPAAKGGSSSGTAGRSANAPDALTVEQARALTREQRLNLMRKGALIFDGNSQTVFLEGVIGALTKDEIEEGVAALATAQNRGNYPAPGVWNALWKQWGRVDAVGVLAHFEKTPQGKSRSDIRHVMEGWYETNPAEALAWASGARTSQFENIAAAYALTRSAEGDVKRLESALLARRADDPVVKETLQDYFDLACTSTGITDSGRIYDQLPDALKPAAWAVAMTRLNYTDPQAAVDWLTKHAGDAGRQYAKTTRLVMELTREDPAGTVAWAARLPDEPAGEDGSVMHPAIWSFATWREKDRAAADAWLLTQPDSAWAAKLRQGVQQEQQSEQRKQLQQQQQQ